MSNELLEQSQQLLPQAIDLRRRIHQQPELGNYTPHTRSAVLAAIDDLDLDIRLSETTSGIVATLNGADDGPTLLIRGDMDALPMPEDTGLEYASRSQGCMHACGHDAHTAMLAMAARLLSQNKKRLHGKVKFMFQPGEESPGGAKPMLNEGIVEYNGAPDAAFAIHIYPNLPAGVIATRPGPLMAGADIVKVRIAGKGGHASMPYDANDPVPVACELVQAMQTFVTRRVKTFDPVVLTVAQINAGTVSNVIPEHVDLSATLRTFTTESQQLAHDGIHRLVENIAAAHDMRGEISIEAGYPPTLNDSKFVGFVGETIKATFGEQCFISMPEPVMASEDFSLVLQRYPGAMAFLGVAPEGTDPQQAAPCHSNRMLLNENAMAIGVALHAAVACEFLNGSSHRLN